jgi:hypothetical protein
MIPSRNTDERFAIRYLVDLRSLTFTCAIFSPAGVSSDDVLRIYYGLPVEEKTWETVKQVLQERMPRE